MRFQLNNLDIIQGSLLICSYFSILHLLFSFLWLPCYVCLVCECILLFCCLLYHLLIKGEQQTAGLLFSQIERGYFKSWGVFLVKKRIFFLPSAYRENSLECKCRLKLEKPGMLPCYPDQPFQSLPIRHSKNFM